MTVIFLNLTRAHGAVEPRICVLYFFILFPRAASYSHPDTVRLISLYCMVRVRIVKRQEIESFQIRRGGQSTNIIFRGNINGSWKQIWGIAGSFIRAGSIINGNGR